MRLRELVEDPDLGLSLLTGSEALDRSLTSVFTTDLRDPSRYLSVGALVLTGLMWWRGPDDSEVFVRAVAGCGVAAVAAGEAALGSVPDDLADACRRHDVALLRVPVDVSFASITDLVAGRHEDERGRRLELALGRQRQLLSAVAEGRSLGDLLSLVSSQTGLGIRVLTPTGRVVATSHSTYTPTGSDLDQLSRAFLTVERLPASVELHDGGSKSIVAVESGLGSRVTSWFLVCDGRSADWRDDVRTTIDELAAVSAVERQRADERWRHDQRAADDFVAAAASGRPSRTELSAHLAELGADPAARFVAVVADVQEGPPDLARVVLRDAALHASADPVAALHNSRAVAIVAVGTSAAASADATARLRTALERLGPGFGRTRLAVGVSEPVAVDALTGAIDEAGFAAHLAAAHSGPVRVVTSDEVASYVALLASVPDDVRRAFATRVLRPVVDYDARHRSDLLPTLEAFLQADCSWQRCAEALHVHVNTVRYRVGRVEELTGRDMSRLEDRVDVLLALRSLPRTRDDGRE